MRTTALNLSQKENSITRRIGMTYGDFIVISAEYKSDGRQRWVLQCSECGNIRVIENGIEWKKAFNKRTNRGESVGGCDNCTKIEREKRKSADSMDKKARADALAKYKSSEEYEKTTKLKRLFRGMKRRCYRANDPNYKNYGARGIKIYEGWLNDPMSFVAWAIANGYWIEMVGKVNQCSIERKDVNGDYSPSNCEFIPLSHQSWNRTISGGCSDYRLNGERKTLRECADTMGLSENALSYRLKRGYTLENATMYIPRKPGKLPHIEINGVKKYAYEWCEKYGVKPATVANRVKRLGLTFEDALTYADTKPRREMWTINGVTKPGREFCADYGISFEGVKYRIKNRGMTLEEALTTPK